MHDLAPLTALGAAQPRRDTVGPLTVTESPDWALASVAARLAQESACAAELAQILGGPAPGVARHARGADMSAFWIAPDAWMVEAPHAHQPDLAASLRARLGATASVTDQTDAWARFDLSGAQDAPLRVLERLCNLDLGRMDAGAARRSVIDHLGCYVIHPALDDWAIYGPRSGAQSLHHALLGAAKSVF